MANKIQLRRGVKASVPTLSAGEPAYTTDTRELYVGTGSGNVNMGGSHWYRGTAMSGTSAAANAYSYSACPQVKLDDMYLNTSNGNLYACTKAGSGTGAKWTYQGCIKGATGETGAAATVTVDSQLSDTSTNPVQNKIIKGALDRLDRMVWFDDGVDNNGSGGQFIGLPVSTIYRLVYVHKASKWFDYMIGGADDELHWNIQDNASVPEGRSALLLVGPSNGYNGKAYVVALI